jgi:hypothetical protein
MDRTLSGAADLHDIDIDGIYISLREGALTLTNPQLNFSLAQERTRATYGNREGERPRVARTVAPQPLQK